MTEVIDKFLIEHGVSESELKKTKHRSWLYPAILVQTFIAIIFVTLAILAWT